MAEAPPDFENKIQFWHTKCAMPADLKDRLHTLRIWANAARHHDGVVMARQSRRSSADRWRAEHQGAPGGRHGTGIGRSGHVECHMTPV
eukprot:2118865-Prymnesium_polylepis.1